MDMMGKRLVVVYVVMFFWILMALLGLFFETDFYDLSVYFLSLTGFIGTYIFSESIRKSKASSIFSSGKSSNRELMIYISMGLWVVLGVFSVVTKKELTQMASYFGALTPFVAAAILGETYKSEEIDAKVGLGSQKIKKPEPAPDPYPGYPGYNQPPHPPYPPSQGGNNEPPIEA